MTSRFLNRHLLSLGIHAAVFSVVIGGVGPTAAAQAPHSQARGTKVQLPAPLTTAIMLLGWFDDAVPRIEIVGTKPPDATATVEAWVRFNADGSAMPIIYVRTDTDVYRAAAQEDYQALVRLAGILAHERWHVRHGRDEIGAYTAQLATMEYLGAHSMYLAVVRRALRMVEQAKRSDPRK
jgi:hypothetical protein